MSHDPYWHEREPSMCAGCERDHYERRREEEAWEEAQREYEREQVRPAPAPAEGEYLEKGGAPNSK